MLINDWVINDKKDTQPLERKKTNVVKNTDSYSKEFWQQGNDVYYLPPSTNSI